MNVLSIVAEIIRIGAEVFLPNRRDLLEWELQKIKEFREELEKDGVRPKIGKDYPIDLRFDVASTRLRRFLSAFNDYKEEPSDENLIRLERMFRELREVYVCPGCAEIYGYISELLEKIKDGGSVSEVLPIIESYTEALLFSIEAANVMREKWNRVKPLEELSKEEKEFLRREVEKRLVEMWS